jgi:hypothetical protein
MQLAERSGRVASAALPPAAESRINAAVSGSPRAPSCDFCQTALTRGERHRLVWEGPLPTTLVLADLCNHCSTRAESLVELYGGRGRDAIRLAQEVRPSAPVHKVVGFIARGVFYLLIAITFFLIVTAISSRAG